MEGEISKKRKKDITILSSAAEYLTFAASTGDSQESIEMRYEDENIWLTQKMIAQLYGVEIHTVNEHIKKIFSDSELQEAATIRIFRIVQMEGTRQASRWVMDGERLKNGISMLTEKYFEEQLVI